MVSTGVLFGITAAFLWALVNIIDRFVMNTEENISNESNIISSISMITLFIISYLLFNITTPTSYFKLTLFLSVGMAYYLAAYFYYTALKISEATDVSILLNLVSIIILITDVLIFKTNITPQQLIGMFAIFFSAIIISYNYNSIKSLQLDKSLYLMIIASTLYAIRSLLADYAITTSQSTSITIYTWSIIGTALLPTLTLLVKKDIRKDCHNIYTNYNSKLKYILFTKNLSGIGALFYFVALDYESVSVISFSTSVQPVFTLILSYTLYKIFKAEQIREKTNFANMSKKIYSNNLHNPRTIPIIKQPTQPNLKTP